MPLNKQQLLQENNTNFPNNNDQLITPQLLRQFNADMIDSMQLTQSLDAYAVLSGSNSFIGNQNIAGNLNVTGTLTATTIHTITESASVIFSSGSNQLGDELTDTQILSGSVKVVGSLTVNGFPVFTGSVNVDTGSLVTTASFNAYTQSNNQRVTSLEANTASVNTSISNLNSFTASQSALNGTFATTGSNTFTGNQTIDKTKALYTNALYWTSSEVGYTNLEIINQGGGNLDFASLNGGRMRIVNTPLILTGSALTSSNDISTSANIYAANLTGSAINTGSLVTTASFNAYTQSNDTIVSSLVITTNAQQILIGNLNVATASLFTSASNALVTASLSGQTLTFRKGDNSTFAVTIPDVSGSDISALNAFTASQLQINSGYNTFTQSIQAEVDSLQAATSSYAISASVAAVDAAQQAQINSLINATSSYADSASFAASQLAQDGRIDGLSAQTSSYVTESETASFARTNVDNNFTANQTFTNITAVSASFTYVQTTYETSSVIYSSGSNQFGDELSDVQTLSGSVKVQGSLTVNGTPVLTSSVDISGLVTTASFNAYTQSNDQRVSSLEANSASVNISITNVNSATASLFTSVNNLNTFTQSAQISINALNAATSSYVTSAITASSLVTASFDNGTRNLTFTKGDASTFAVNIPDVSGSTGNFATTGSNTFRGTQTIETGDLLMGNGFRINAPSGNITNLSAETTIQFITEGTAGPGGTNDIKFYNRVTGSSISFINEQAGAGNEIYFEGGKLDFNIAPRSGSTGIVTFRNNVASIDASSTPITASAFKAGAGGINSAGALTASLQQGYAWVGNSSGVSTLVATSSFGTTINTGSFATTGSNTFIGTQTISGSVLPLVDGQGDLGTDSLKWNSVVVNGQVKGSSVNGSGRNNLGTVLIGDETFPLSFLSAREIVGDGSGIDTHMYYGTGSATDALREFVYAPSGSNANFTQVSQSFDSRINGIVAGTGFATTGSNTFTGNQTISTAGNSQLTLIAQPGFQTNVEFQSENSNFQAYGDFRINNNGQFGGSGSVKMLVKDNFIELAADQGFRMGVTNGIGNGIDNSGFVTINVPSGSQQFQLTGSLVVSNTLTASLQQGYAWVGDSNNRSVLVATSSFGGTVPAGTYATLGANVFTGSQVITNGALSIAQSGPGTSNFSMSGSQNSLNFYAPSTFFQSFGLFNFNNGYTSGGSGSLQFSAVSSSIGLYPTNGLILGRTTVEAGPGGNGFVRMNTTSGSLVLTPSGFSNNAADLLHLSSSSNTNNVNLIFKGSNNTTDTIISGSQNIFSNPAAPTAGFKRVLTNNNLALQTSLVPQVSASMNQYVTYSNNTLAGSGGMIMRGPVSSSAWTISGNLLNNTSAYQIGSSATLNAQQIVSGLNMGNNIGSGFPVIQAWKTPLSASFTYSTNQSAGIVNILLHSSSMNMGGNISYGGTTINNSYFPVTSSITGQNGFVAVQSNIFLGSSNINFSGSNSFTTTPGSRILQNSIMTGYNSASLVLNSDNGNINALAMFGNGLSVTGSNTPQISATIPGDWGSVFVGRYNAQDGNRARTAETVFAVGTGNTTTAKTGFLIDSGSNTFIEGTLNVSGSTSLTGSLYIQSGSTLPSATGSSILTWNSATGQVSQSPIATLISSSFSVGAFNSTVTQSGSAAVSQSMTFNNTDISNGVSIVSNSQITLANTGTYNIQFSAQLLAGTGADTIWIWLKKNGTNVSNTGTKLVLANNEASVAAWNFVVPAVATDYFELVWQSLDGHATLLTEAAAGNYPAIPSVIVTVTQVE